jgi:hypothetical protein
MNIYKIKYKSGSEHQYISVIKACDGVAAIKNLIDWANDEEVKVTLIDIEIFERDIE